MPLRNAQHIVHYPIYDIVTGDKTADAVVNHTYTLLADGVIVAVADAGATTSLTGVNKLTIAAGENTGKSMWLSIATATSGLKIPDIAWDNDLAQPTVAEIVSGLTTAVNIINVPIVAYNGNMNLYSGNSYDGDLNPPVVIPSTLTADISAATAYITISSQENDQGTLYYTASDGVITGTSGAWSVSYDIPTSGTTDLPLGVQSCFYHCYVSDGVAVATVGKGKVNVK